MREGYFHAKFSLLARGWIMKKRFPLSNYLAYATSFNSMLYKHKVTLIYFWYYFLRKKNSCHILCKQEPYPNARHSLMCSTWKIWEQLSMKHGKLFSPSHCPITAPQRILQVSLTLSRQQDKSSLQGEAVILFFKPQMDVVRIDLTAHHPTLLLRSHRKSREK